MAELIPVILSGGEGSRLWPLSTPQKPKQFHTLCGSNTLLETTLGRVHSLSSQTPLVICNKNHRDFVKTYAPSANVIVEPFPRNTAAAFAAAGVLLERQNETSDPWLLFLPSDHVIGNQDAFVKAINTIIESGQSEALHTFGIVPKYAHTGYGYIHAKGEQAPLEVQAFVEKPTLEKAEALLASGHHYWNSGMFLMRRSALKKAFSEYASDIWSSVDQALEDHVHDQAYYLNESRFAEVESISFDYAIMEKTKHVRLMPLDAGWNDIGSWNAVWESCTKDSMGNVKKGSITTVDAENNLIFSTTDRHIALAGIHDKVVVDTQGALLFLDKSQDQQIKTVLSKMANEGVCSNTAEGKTYRPWGWFEVLQTEPNHVVKRIMVRPKGILSLQRHKHRSEHWVVVSGIASVTKGEDQFQLKVGESIFIELGELHRLENKTDEPIYIIETQVGSLLSEDDIERLEDVYGRA